MREDAMWTTQEHLLAHLIDAVQANTWVLQNKEVERSKRSRPPTPFPRPADLRKQAEKGERDAEQGRAHREFVERMNRSRNRAE